MGLLPERIYMFDLDCPNCWRTNTFADHEGVPSLRRTHEEWLREQQSDDDIGFDADFEGDDEDDNSAD